jgi:hypothetical protein
MILSTKGFFRLEEGLWHCLLQELGTGGALLSVLRDLEHSADPALIRFRDGDAYVVRVISTTHAEAGDNIVAEVLRPVAAGFPVPAGAFMDFLLGDVAEVARDRAQAFPHTPDTTPGTSAEGEG